MAGAPDPRLFPYADHVLDTLEANEEYTQPIRAAARGGETLTLDFHVQSNGEGWCAAVLVEGRDVVHLRGIVKHREECEPMARVLTGLMTARYRLSTPPDVVVDGAPVCV